MNEFPVMQDFTLEHCRANPDISHITQQIRIGSHEKQACLVIYIKLELEVPKQME